MNILKTETVVHIIANQDAQKCFNDVNAFLKDKDAADIEKIYNTTPMMVGVSQLGGAHSAQIQMILTCTIFWKCTPEKATTFRNTQRLSLKS